MTSLSGRSIRTSLQNTGPNATRLASIAIKRGRSGLQSTRAFFAIKQATLSLCRYHQELCPYFLDKPSAGMHTFYMFRLPEVDFGLLKMESGTKYPRLGFLRSRRPSCSSTVEASCGRVILIIG